VSGCYRAGIAGTGAAVPERVVTNDDLAGIVDTSDAWIHQRTGIRERRFAGPGENTSHLSVRAAQQALDRAGVDAGSLDLIIVGTLTPDYLLPSTACLVQDRLGAKSAGAFDVSAACTGFLSALHTAEAFVAAGRARRVLAIGAETLSRFLDMNERSSCVLFGDGAGAALVTRWEDCEQGEILDHSLGADGSGYEFIHMPMGGAAFPPHHPGYEKSGHFIRLKGREVYKFAVSTMTDLVQKLADKVDPEEVALIIPHQVNARIIESSAERLGYCMDRFMLNIDKYGNTSAASVPIALHEAVESGRLQKDQLVALVAFGAGLTWGATLLRW